MSRLIEAVSTDLLQCFYRGICRVAHAVRSSSSDSACGLGGGMCSTTSTSSSAAAAAVGGGDKGLAGGGGVAAAILSVRKMSGKRQLSLLTAAARECLQLGYEVYAWIVSLWCALCNLVVAPIIPVMSGVCFFKDADWRTWIAREKTGFWSGKVAWITGASSGIGASLARALAKRGVPVILSGRDTSALELVKSSIVSIGYLRESDVLILPMELAHIDKLPTLVQKALLFKGKVNLLFNNAGMTSQESVESSSWTTSEDILRVNLLAPIRLTQEILPHMLSLSESLPPNTTSPSSSSSSTPPFFSSASSINNCSIIFTNSAMGLVTLPCHSAYSVSKHGLTAYARTLQGELAGREALYLTSAPPPTPPRPLSALSKDKAKDSSPPTTLTTTPSSSSHTPSSSSSSSSSFPSSAVTGWALSVALRVKNIGSAINDEFLRISSQSLLPPSTSRFLPSAGSPPPPPPAGRVTVTSVFPGHVNTELCAKRLDSHRGDRVVGVRPVGGGEEAKTMLKRVAAESKSGISAERCAELMLTAVSNQQAEVWVGTMSDMLVMHLQHYAPDLMTKLVSLTRRGMYKKYVLLEKDEVEGRGGGTSALMTTSTTANTSQSQLVVESAGGVMGK